jgi:hypothetical protein
MVAIASHASCCNPSAVSERNGSASTVQVPLAFGCAQSSQAGLLRFARKTFDSGTDVSQVQQLAHHANGRSFVGL